MALLVVLLQLGRHEGSGLGGASLVVMGFWHGAIQLLLLFGHVGQTEWCFASVWRDGRLMWFFFPREPQAAQRRNMALAPPRFEIDVQATWSRDALFVDVDGSK